MRVQLGTLKPIDWDKQTLAEKFRSALQKRGLLGDLHLDCNLVLFFCSQDSSKTCDCPVFLVERFLAKRCCQACGAEAENDHRIRAPQKVGRSNRA